MTRPFFAMGSYKTRTAMSSASVMAASGASYVAMQPQFSATSSATSGGASRVNAELSVIPSLTPSLRGFSIARAAMSSPFAAAVSFGGSSTVVSEPNWTNPEPTTLPTFYNTNTESAPLDLTQYLQNFNSSTQTIQFVGTHDNFNLSGAGSKLLTFDGSAGVNTSPGYPLVFTVVDNTPPVQTDWQSRSTAAGVTHAQNFASYNTIADVYNGNSLFNFSRFLNDPAFPNAFELVTDPTHVLSGKAIRLWHGKNNYGSAGNIDNQYVGVAFNGNKNALGGQYPTGAYLTKVYIQVVVWMDAHLDYDWRIDSIHRGGNKVIIVDCDYETATWGEVVVNNIQNTGFIEAYRMASNSNWAGIRTSRTGTGLLGSPDYQVQNAIDANPGGATPNTQAAWLQRYGIFDMTPDRNWSQATPLSTQGIPNADALMSGAVNFKRGGHTVFEVEIDLPSQRIRIWAAHYGNQPKFIIDTGAGNASLGTRVKNNGTGWNTLWLSNLIYGATGANNPGYPNNAYTDYAEIIISQNQIPFPLQLGVPLP